MQSRKLCSQVGKDGILHLDIPVGVTNSEIEVMVIYQLLEPSAQAKTLSELGWPLIFLSRQQVPYRMIQYRTYALTN
ncbi:MAG: hypothetical protein PUP92_09050 [Rhizonema sp. PD38]|nr:hypothetical protein [Rhizonema sp. PD38]